MFTVYIIYSKKLNKYYTGFTGKDVEDRILRHNTKAYGNNHFTSLSSDWVLYFKIRCESNNQARNIERHIKSMKSRVYFENLLKYPELKDKLLKMYSTI